MKVSHRVKQVEEMNIPLGNKIDLAEFFKLFSSTSQHKALQSPGCELVKKPKMLMLRRVLLEGAKSA